MTNKKKSKLIIKRISKNLRIKSYIMVEGMNNVWVMVLGWMIGFIILVVLILSLVKIVDRNKNPGQTVPVKKLD